MAHVGGIRQVHVLAAVGADLDVELVDATAVGAAALGLVAVEAVEDHGDQAQTGQHHADREPDQEGAALRPADPSGCGREHEHDREAVGEQAERRDGHPTIMAGR